MDGEKIVYFKVRFLFRKVCLFITKRSFGLFLRINFGSGMKKLLNLITVQVRRKVWKSGGAHSIVFGIICPPGWDRVNCFAKNWGAKAPNPPPPCDGPAVKEIEFPQFFLTVIRVHISSDEVFSEILKKPSIVQNKLYFIWKALVFSLRWSKKVFF